MDKQLIITEPDELKQVIRDALNEVLDERVPELPSDQRDYYTRDEVAEKWRVSVVSLWRYAKMGLIHPVKIGNTVRFPKEEIDGTVDFDIVNSKRKKTKAERNIRKAKNKNPGQNGNDC